MKNNNNVLVNSQNITHHIDDSNSSKVSNQVVNKNGFGQLRANIMGNGNLNSNINISKNNNINNNNYAVNNNNNLKRESSNTTFTNPIKQIRNSIINSNNDNINNNIINTQTAIQRPNNIINNHPNNHPNNHINSHIRQSPNHHAIPIPNNIQSIHKP